MSKALRKPTIHLKLGMVCATKKKCRRIPHSPNSLNSMCWQEKSRWKKAWETEVWGRWQEIKGRYTAYWKYMPFKQARLTFFVFTVQPQDTDNAFASFKGVIDGLVKAMIIIDDRCDMVKINPIKFVPIKNKKIEHIELSIKIEEYGQPKIKSI